MSHFTSGVRLLSLISHTFADSAVPLFEPLSFLQSSSLKVLWCPQYLCLKVCPCHPDAAVRVAISSHYRSVDNVLGLAVSRDRTISLVLLQAVASCIFARFCPVDHIRVVMSNFGCQAACARVTQFHCVAVKMLVPKCSLYEACIHNLQEPLSDLCFHLHVYW